MKNKKSIFLFTLSLFLSNCTQPSAIPTSVNAQPTSVIIPASTNIKPTSYILPTLTPPITLTEQPVPSATTVVTLPTMASPIVESTKLGGLSSPPYLVYVKRINGKEQAVLVNQGGTGLKIIPLPDNGFASGNPSPTGEWLVFYTGSGGEQTLTNGPKYDLALNLMHLPDGTTHKVTDLLSRDFPDSIEKFSEIAKSSNDPDIAFMDTGTIADAVRQSLIYRLMINSWSPSGEVLAFAGEMDGPSTDLYLYNLKTGNIKRLSSGSKNVDFIRWFPSGDKIVYSSSYLPCEGDCSTYYVTNLDGTHSMTINNFNTFGGATSTDSWTNNSLLTIYTQANVTGTCCLRNFDFESDKVNMLYGGSFQTYAYDPQTNLLAISIADNLENVSPGIYFIDKSGMRKVEEPGSVYYLGWKEYPFIISAGSMKILSSSGISTMLTEGGFAPFASRNNQYVALSDLEWSQTTNGLRVFDKNSNLVLDINGKKITKVIWRLDSQGLFYISKKQLYYVGIQEKKPVLIDSHVNDGVDTSNISFNWVR
jgi:dipeptidyl aminopeptidase/acylaminoacyl peptidase